ncbi:MAG: hypothetical protein ABI680_13040, partial [Chthoniobacteraceae bacterium]
VLANIPIGQQPQALVYVPEAVPEGDGTANLIPLGETGKAAHLTLAAPEAGGTARATVSVNAVGPLDLLQAAVTGLKPGQNYTLWLVTSRTVPFGKKDALATFKTNIAGAQIVQAIGPLRQVLDRTGRDAAGEAPDRFLLVTPADSDAPELVQAERFP